MFEKKGQDAHGDRTVKAFLEHGCEFEGRLTFSGIVRVNGKLKGDIISDNTLIVGETADIEGTLAVGSIIIGGHVVGDIVAKQRIEIHSTGVVKGKVTAPLLVMQEGGQIDGQISILSKQQPQAHMKPQEVVPKPVPN